MEIERFLEAKHFNTQRDQLLFAIAMSPVDGYILEFGVAGGSTINLIANKVAPNVVWGFDSFEGIPEQWIKGDGRDRPAGKHKQFKLPRVPKNVELVKGWFKDTIYIWKMAFRESISFIHIDSDLYSSARTVLFELNDQIVENTIIVFDELLDAGRYPLWKEGEWKALKEWCKKKNREYFVLSTCQPKWESAVIMISK